MNPPRRRLLQTGFAGLALALIHHRVSVATPDAITPEGFAVTHTDAEWKARLSAEQYQVLRQHGTERPHTSALNKEKRRGVFNCAGCGQALFSSDTKYESGTGWPSFWKPLAAAVGETTDDRYGMQRTEVHCQRCGGHLGHVFPDGPRPTGLRYCMNGVALQFVPTES